MFEKIEKWLRWQIVELLDNRRDTCWADLTVWALFPEHHDFLEILPFPRRGFCLRVGPFAYCGKCDVMHDLEIAEIQRLRWVFHTLKY